jgi:hypothetical protein
MKKAVLVLSLTGILFISGFGFARAQEKPKPKKDTVNMDTDAKPVFYYAVEDEKAKGPAKGGSTATIVMICGAVVIVSVVVFFLLKKKK